MSSPSKNCIQFWRGRNLTPKLVKLVTLSLSRKLSCVPSSAALQSTIENQHESGEKGKSDDKKKKGTSGVKYERKVGKTVLLSRPPLGRHSMAVRVAAKQHFKNFLKHKISTNLF